MKINLVNFTPKKKIRFKDGKAYLCPACARAVREGARTIEEGLHHIVYNNGKGVCPRHGQVGFKNGYD